MKKKYKEVADRLHRSSVGIESDDEPYDHQVYVLGLKWFSDLHALLRTRDVVNPLVLLDTSTPDTSAVSNPDSNDQELEPEREQPTKGEQAQIDSDQPDSPRSSAKAAAPGPTLSSSHATTPGPSISSSSATAPGTSTSDDTIQRLAKKKRKTTKTEKMEASMKNLFEKFTAQQEKAR